jgi:hypothetical protein
VSQTEQTWAIVAATVAAAILGVIVGFIGTAFLQARQAKADTRVRYENALAELLAAAQDLVIGIRAIRQAHERRTRPRYYLRIAAMIMRDWPVPGTWRDLADPSRWRPLLATALEADRYQLDESRLIALDLATVVAAKVNRYLAVAALLTLGQDREIADAVRKLTPKVTGLAEALADRSGKFERLSNELHRALEEFRNFADKRLGNVTMRRGRLRRKQPIAANQRSGLSVPGRRRRAASRAS